MIGSYVSSKSSRKGSGRKLRVAVEGNIASGKSTLLKKLSQLHDVEVLIEPVDKWRDIGGSNLIGRMYQDPKRWSYLFQSYVLLTMMELHHKETASPVCMLERSIFSARFCFIENLHNNGILDDAEYSCYCKWFEYIMKTNPPHLDLIVYIRASPEVCYKRLQERGRQEESPVQLSYLESLHECYEEWLGDKAHHQWHGNTPVLVINGDDDISKDKMIYANHSTKIMSSLLPQPPSTVLREKN
uniref:Deoxynucleoside kinase domain-containing protein n=1 Tax=Amphimedon queenslandica TaxID=400682 RepID=A0A1X7VMT7_AMPQE